MEYGVSNVNQIAQALQRTIGGKKSSPLNIIFNIFKQEVRMHFWKYQLILYNSSRFKFF